eukprot:1147132-Amphidinium_carterae.1
MSESKKLFEDAVTVAGGWVQIRLSGKGLTDDHILRLVAYLRDVLPETGVWANMDLAENNLTSVGLQSILALLEEKSVMCKCIKLYKNRINDAGGLSLAKYLQKQAEFVEEVLAPQLPKKRVL